jgi:Family of unknown function (DUF6600)
MKRKETDPNFDHSHCGVPPQDTHRNPARGYGALVGLVVCGACILAPTGCTTYVQEGPASAYTGAPPVYSIPAEAPPPPVVAVAPEPAANTGLVVIHSENDFFQPLRPYGEWVYVTGYGRCWRPLRVEAGWQPYADGDWQRTDAGWYWETDEPWGWATYHYGRWGWNAGLGWFWVPQIQWAPAWVAWREGDGYIGWAPLSPGATISVGGGVVFHDESFAPRAFVFVQENRLLDRVRPGSVIVNRPTVMNRTVNITKIHIVNKTVINEGPRPDAVERAVGRRIQPVAFRELRHKQESKVAETRRPLKPSLTPRVSASPAAPAGRINGNPPVSVRTAQPGSRKKTGFQEQPARGAPKPGAAPGMKKPADRPPLSQPVAGSKPFQPNRAKPIVAETSRRARVESKPPAVRRPAVEKPLRSPKAKAVLAEKGKSPPGKNDPSNGKRPDARQP